MGISVQRWFDYFAQLFSNKLLDSYSVSEEILLNVIPGILKV